MDLKLLSIILGSGLLSSITTYLITKFGLKEKYIADVSNIKNAAEKTTFETYNIILSSFKDQLEESASQIDILTAKLEIADQKITEYKLIVENNEKRICVLEKALIENNIIFD